MPASPPIKYKKEFVNQVKVACRLGATQADLAELLEVSLPTIKKWMVKYPDFKKAYDTYREIADEQVERSLYERARGYSCVETKAFLCEGEVLTRNVIKHYPPDSTSMIFWLKNRKPKHWTDKVEKTDNASSEDKLIEAVNGLIEKLPS